VIKKALLSFAVLAIGLAAAEGLVRVFARRTTVMFPRFHTDAHYGPYTIRRFRPNMRFLHTSIDGRWEFRINSQGFRADKDYAYDKPPAVIRVLCLGDSHTAGFECRQEKTYASVIERYFARRGRQVEAINTGVSGFGTAEELVLLENEGVKYRPDFVVVGFSGNDFDDNVRGNLFGLKNGALTTNQTTYAPGVAILNRINDIALLRWLSQHSYLYSFGLNSVWEYRQKAALHDRQTAVATEMVVRQANVTADLTRYQYDLTVALLQRMHAFCRQHGAKLIIVEIPQDEKAGFSSIPSELREPFRQNCDVLLDSELVNGDYRGLMQLSMPHGHHHITKGTHMLIGIQIAKAMERSWGDAGGP